MITRILREEPTALQIAIETITAAIAAKADREQWASVPYVTLREWALGEGLQYLILPAWHDLLTLVEPEEAAEVFRSLAKAELAERGLVLCAQCGTELSLHLRDLVRRGRLPELCADCAPPLKPLAGMAAWQAPERVAA